MCRQFAPTLRGCLSGWLVPTAVLLWTGAPISLMVRCTICRGVMMEKSTPGCSRTFTIVEIPRELELFLRMSRERLRLCCGLQCTNPAPEALSCSSQTVMVRHWNRDCSLRKWGTGCFTRCHPATSPPWRRTCTGYVECYCTSLVWRAYWLGNKWCLWSWQNPVCCCLAGWIIGLWPEP